MIPPVSVCHQLSWIGRPNASSPQSTASGLSGSPTLAMKRSAGGVESLRAHPRPRASSCARRSAPCTRRVTRCRAGCRTSARRRSRASSTMLVTPCVSGEMMPYDVPVTQPGSAVHQKTSSSWRSSARLPVAWCATTASWTWTAPFGLPVVPLVKWSSAMSSGRSASISNVVLARPRRARRSRACRPARAAARRGRARATEAIARIGAIFFS